MTSVVPLDPGPRSELRRLYEELDAEVAGRGPVCLVSGRCCRFREYDHRLFLTGVEAAFLLTEGPPPVRALDDGATCPWQDRRGHCQARDARPSGCRIYFCDPNHQEAMPDLSESFLGRLKALTTTHGLVWDYAPLHDHLRRAAVPDAAP